MEIEFNLVWTANSRSISKSFKHIASFQLFSDYVSRISKFIPCRVAGPLKEPEKRIALWVCEIGKGAVTLTSEDLAKRFEKLLNSGIKKLRILIGGPNGFSESELKDLKPDLKWSFGPLTLPHELAAVVASEQIYRALTIINKMPYHLGH